MWKKLREKQRNRQECTTAAAVVRILGGKFLEVHMKKEKLYCPLYWSKQRKSDIVIKNVGGIQISYFTCIWK